ncbi:MAG: HDOD domain-containing protein, partial [Pseudomonadota bacterium]|nr:HDOD domain-containing protein [Pseudomonadota bacterium]
MLDVAILGQVALGYSPFILRDKSIAATHLSVFPVRPDAALDVAQLLHAVGDVWPASGGAVVLNVVSESLLRDLLRARPSANLMLEVPNFMAADPANSEALLALHKAGNVLLLNGRPNAELPREVLPCFRHAVIDFGDDRRIGAAAPSGDGAAARAITIVHSGVHSVADMDASFASGAHAVVGWPLEDEAGAAAAKRSRPAAQTDIHTVAELIRQVDNTEPIEKLEATLKRDPSLAFKLLRYMNSPAFGLRVEVNSFRQAIMMLGYARLKRWLALLLATASKDENLRPVMFAAIRRGLLMEELCAGNDDAEMKNEVSICGVFSLLDRMF